MASKYISVIRHADYLQRPSVPSAYQPFPLSYEGKEQANGIAPAIKNFLQTHHLKIHPTIFSSSLLRAWQTADIIRENFKMEMSINSTMDLAERSVGSVANLTMEEIEEVLQQDPRYDVPPKNWKSDSFYRLPFPGAESLMEAGERVVTCLKRICTSIAEGELAIVVGHGASIRHAAFKLGILSQTDISNLSMFYCRPVYFEVLDGNWSHVAGDWKVRTQTEKPD